MEAGDELPAVRKLIEQVDLVKLALEAWEEALKMSGSRSYWLS